MDKEMLLMRSGFIHNAIPTPYAADAVATAAIKIIIELEQRIAELEAERRWIPVSEQLPGYGKLVLTLSDNGPEIDYLKTSDKFTQEFPTDCGMPVIHWMPLPPPPEDNTITGATVPGSRKPQE